MKITEEMVEHCKRALWDTMEAFVAETSKKELGDEGYTAQAWEEGDEEERKVTEHIVRTVLTEALPLWAVEFAKELQDALSQLPTQTPPDQLGVEESKPVDEFLEEVQEALSPGVRRVRHQGVSREVTDVVAPMLVDPWMER